MDCNSGVMNSKPLSDEVVFSTYQGFKVEQLSVTDKSMNILSSKYWLTAEPVQEQSDMLYD